MNDMITIDDAIRTLQSIRERSRLGGGTVLVLSLSGSGLEVTPVNSLFLEQPDDGAVVEVRVSHPALI